MKVTKIIKALENALTKTDFPQDLKQLLAKPYNKTLIEKLLKQLNAFSETGKPFLLFFQPGAGAPVELFMDEWKKEGLAGCTGELCEINKLTHQHVVINSMSPEEQALGFGKIKAAKNVDLSHMSIFNDPDQILSKIFEMESYELKTVNKRSIYFPQVIACNANGVRVVTEYLFNAPETPGEPRSSKAYMEKIDPLIEKTLKAKETVVASSSNSFQPPAKQLKMDSDVEDTDNSINP